MAVSEGAPVRFAVVGLDHVHVFGMTRTVLDAGGELVGYAGAEGDLSPVFEKLFPSAPRAESAEALLEGGGAELLVCAAVPDRRAALAADAMRRGLDVLVDKPGAVRLDELADLRRVQAETGRRWVVYFSERLESRATLRALRMVQEGAVGRPVHVLGLGPHRLGLAPRPPWFFEPARSGGILGDLASHQVDQFLLVAGRGGAEVAYAAVANYAHPQHPRFEDTGELALRGPSLSGYARVDWFTPDGLATWGDVRLTVVGSEGTIEVRKNCDLAGREGGDHLFLVDAAGVRHIDCSGDLLPLGPALLRDVRQRSEEAMDQDHSFAASELALRAQVLAERRGSLRT